jgi:hypothetical protein
VTFCVTQVTFFVTTKTPTSPGGSGSARPPRKALGSTAAFHLWQPPLAQPHPRTLPGRIRKRMASASDRQMFADARSASLRKLGLWLVSELSPLGKVGLGWRPSEGRALHDRQGMPRLDRAMSPVGHRLLLNRIRGRCPVGFASEWPRHSTDKCSRTRGAHPFQTRPLDCLQVVPVRQPAFGVPPSEGRAPHDRQGKPWLHRGIPPLATASCSTPSEDPARYDPQANGLGMRPTNVRGRAERIPPQTRLLACFRIVPARQNGFGLAPLGGSGSARPPRKALAPPRHLPIWPPPLAGPPGWAFSSRPHKWASAFDRHIFTDARSASLRKRYSRQLTFRVLFPQGHTLGVGPSEGRALHDRQGKPWLDRGIPPLATACCSTVSHVRPLHDRNSRPYGFHRRSSFGHLPLLDPLRMMLFEENPHLDPTQSHSTPCKKKIAPSSQTPISAR